MVDSVDSVDSDISDTEEDIIKKVLNAAEEQRQLFLSENFNKDSNDNYTITLKNFDDLSKFYEDMETIGGDSCIPSREVEILDRMGCTNSCIYSICYHEVENLLKDSRILNIEKYDPNLKYKPLWEDKNVLYTKTKDTNYLSHKNWGLLRHTEENNRTGWGNDYTLIGDGNYHYHAGRGRTYGATLGLNYRVAGDYNYDRVIPGYAGPYTEGITTDVTVTASGKNVDVVIVDGHINPNHPEFAVNADGTGGSRVVQYNWLQHNPAVTGGAPGTYVYTPYDDVSDEELDGDNNHGCHVASTVAGNTMGWARDANIYNISPYGTNSNSDVTGTNLWNYITEFHKNKPVNPNTGRKNPTITNHSYGFTSTTYSAAWARYCYKGELGGVHSRTSNYNYGLGGGTYYEAEIVDGGSGYTTGNLVYFNGLHIGNGGSGLRHDAFFKIIAVDANGAITDLEFHSCYGPLITLPPSPDITFNGLSPANGNGIFNITKKEADFYYEQVISSVKNNGVTINFNKGTHTTAISHSSLGQHDIYTYEQYGYPEDYNVWVKFGLQNKSAEVAVEMAKAEEAGVIFCFAAGNEYSKLTVSDESSPDWDDEINKEVRWYTQPHINVADGPVLLWPKKNRRANSGQDYGGNNIVVGALSAEANEEKAQFSNTGSGNTVHAAGEVINSATNTTRRSTPNGYFFNAFEGYAEAGTPYYEDTRTSQTDTSGNTLGGHKIRGTSMASPQVCGVLACLAEYWPNMTQKQAKEWLINNASLNKMTSYTGIEREQKATNFTYFCDHDLVHSPNRILRWYNQRPVDKQVFPNNIFPASPKPASGRTYPRPRIRRRG